ncbi:hypothetical protein EQH57_0071 [Dictyocoela roeselum]|nr:hypothetical protein EQH57_0071 [Dictyocoela roeselum]
MPGNPWRAKSINNFMKSVLVSYLQYGHPYGDHDILSLKSRRNLFMKSIAKEENWIKQTIHVDPNVESASFEYRNDQSGLKIIHKLNLLRTVDDQDLINWKNCFLEVARICKWSDAVQQEVLTQIIDINLQYQIGSTCSADETLYKVLKLKYNQSTANIYQKRLLNIKQSSFHTTRAYLKEIKDNCQKLAICLDWDNKTTEIKTQEIFNCGLHERVRFEIYKSNQRDFNCILTTLLNMESFIIENESQRERNFNGNKGNDFIKSENKDQNFSRVFKSKHHEKVHGKYCTLHKTSSHNNDECRKQQGGKNEHNKRSASKNYLMSEPCPPAKIVKIPIDINGNEISGIIDTGSDKNFITAKIANENDLNPRKMEKEENVQIADGRYITIKREIDLNFSLLNDSQTMYQSKFHVIEEQTDDAIIGMQFLKENDAIIDFKNDKITLDNKEYRLNS